MGNCQHEYNACERMNDYSNLILPQGTLLYTGTLTLILVEIVAEK